MRRTTGPVGMLVAVALASAACGDDGETTPGSGGADGSGGATSASTGSTGASTTSSAAGAGGEGGEGGSAVELTITWEPCPLYSNGQEGRTVECATIQVPAQWDDPASEPVDFFVKRVPALEQPARAQVWYLQGGPGYAGDAFDPLADIYDDVVTDVDQYIPDHRGTGRSSRLGCSGEQPGTPGGTQIAGIEWTLCFSELAQRWGDALAGFNVTNAARDVGEVIAATRTEGQQVIVFGGSYGSIWANRYLTLYPEQPTAVGMSALAVNTRLDMMDRWFDGLGERWMAACADDEVCGERLGPDPWATMTETLDALDEGSCPAISFAFDRRTLQQIWTSFYYGWGERTLVAPMVYRLQRCAPEDVAAFDHLFDLLTSPQAADPNDPTPGYFSLLLSGAITLSELWSDPPPTLEEILAFRDEANVAHGLPELFAAHHDAWPRYTPDEHAGVLAPPAPHMLMFSGDYDFIPQEARQATIDHFESDTRPFFLLPRASHVLGGAPVAGEPSCGIQLVQGFITDPEGTADLDASCLEEIAPIVWDPSGTPVAADYLGVDDVWDGDPAAIADGAVQAAQKPIPPIPWHVQRELAPVRERLRELRLRR